MIQKGTIFPNKTYTLMNTLNTLAKETNFSNTTIIQIVDDIKRVIKRGTHSGTRPRYMAIRIINILNNEALKTIANSHSNIKNTIESYKQEISKLLHLQ